MRRAQGYFLRSRPPANAFSVAPDVADHGDPPVALASHERLRRADRRQHRARVALGLNGSMNTDT
jgi:hypothetical protein